MLTSGLTSDQLRNSTVRGTVYRKRDYSWIYAFKLPINKLCLVEISNYGSKCMALEKSFLISMINSSLSCVITK